MPSDPKSVQRSFRFSAHTVELLDQEAAASGLSRNALAERLLGEALRVQHHPLIRFHQGAGGRRQPLIVGTRLSVHQVVATLRESDGDLDEAATYLGADGRSGASGAGLLRRLPGRGR
jgi:Ribbon-helix-helix protein, copG family.